MIDSFRNEENNYLTRFNEILNNMKYRMLNPCVKQNITLDFIVCMIPHHEAAIYMCKNLLEYSDFKPLIKMCNKIIKMQTDGIMEMKEIGCTTNGFNNSYSETKEYLIKYINITDKMICKMSTAPKCNNINYDFINEMIPHHEGAVNMCENLLKYCIDPRLKEVASSIIIEQSKGIKELMYLKNSFCNCNLKCGK